MKFLSVIGIVLVVIASGMGYFFDFSGDTIAAIATGFFGATLLVVKSFKDEKAKGKFSWKTIVTGVIAASGGITCAVGGVTQSVIATAVGATLTIITVIVGAIRAKKT